MFIAVIAMSEIAYCRREERVFFALLSIFLCVPFFCFSNFNLRKISQPTAEILLPRVQNKKNACYRIHTHTRTFHEGFHFA